MLMKVNKLEVVAPYKLFAEFSNGARGTHDFATMVSETGPMIEPLRDPSYFAQAFLEFGAPTWPNGFDMAPDWLHDEMKMAGELTPAVAAE